METQIKRSRNSDIWYAQWLVFRNSAHKLWRLVEYWWQPWSFQRSLPIYWKV